MCTEIVTVSFESLCSCNCFQNTDRMAASNVTRDFRVRPPRSQILKLTKGTAQEYDKICSVEKPSSQLQAYVIIVITLSIFV